MAFIEPVAILQDMYGTAHVLRYTRKLVRDKIRADQRGVEPVLLALCFSQGKCWQLNRCHAYVFNLHLFYCMQVCECEQV